MGHPTLSPAYQLWHGENRPQHLMLSKHVLGALGPVGNPTVHALKILPTANCRKNTLNLRFLTQTRPKNSQLPSFQDLTFRLPHPICKWTTKDCPLLTWDPSNFPILQHHGWLWQRFGFPGLQSPHQNKNPWSANKARRQDKANDAPVAMSHELWKHLGHSWISPWNDEEIENTKTFRNLVITQKSPILCAKCLPNTWKVWVAACAAAIVPSMKVGYLALIVGYACGKGFRSRCSAFVHFVSRGFLLCSGGGADLGPPHFAVDSATTFMAVSGLDWWGLQCYLIFEEEGAKSYQYLLFLTSSDPSSHSWFRGINEWYETTTLSGVKILAVLHEVAAVPWLSQQWGWGTLRGSLARRVEKGNRFRCFAYVHPRLRQPGFLGWGIRKNKIGIKKKHIQPQGCKKCSNSLRVQDQKENN